MGEEEAKAQPEIVRPTFHFRKLSIKQRRQFRAWARANYEPYTPIDGTWHPVIQAECASVNDELATYTMAKLIDEGGNIVWCEQCGEDPAEVILELANLCQDCNDNYCQECGFMWAAHNDDGSCVER